MTVEFKDLVKDQFSTTGTGSFTINGIAPTGLRTIAAAHTTGVTIHYRAFNDALTEWEIGEGVWTAATNTLTRARIVESSNANALVNFSVGTKSIITTVLAEDVAGMERSSNKDASGGYAGLTLHKLNLRNAADTFTSFLTNAATAARTWTLPDYDGTISMLSDFMSSLTGSAKLPAGTTAQRDATPALGYFRANSTLNRLEWWNASQWAPVSSGPNFSVYQGTLQSIPNATPTKVQFQNTEWDIGSFFDSVTNYRFQPNVAGYYDIVFAILGPASSVGVSVPYIYKNGSLYKLGASVANNTVQVSCGMSCQVHLNGTTDYIEAWYYQSTGSAQDTTPSVAYVYLQGVLNHAA